MRAVGAWVRGRAVLVLLDDGRVKAFAADKYSRLRAATDAQLAAVRLRSRAGSTLRWDDLDEDIEVSIACREGAPELCDVAIPSHIQAALARVAGDEPRQ